MEKDKKNIAYESYEKAVEDFAKGSSEAFSYLYSIYSRQIFRFCSRILNDETLAKDAFQETFMKVYEFRNSFRGNKFESWLFTTARNTCLTYIRKIKITK